MTSKSRSAIVRNDPTQYDDLAETWWEPFGPLAMLHWIAKARAALIPQTTGDRGLLVDLGCGAGALAPYLTGKGYLHIGIDLSRRSLPLAVEHGVRAIRGDVCSVPLTDASADVVSAGEILEHVSDLRATLDEACRILRPGGLLVIDTIARTRLAHVVAVGIAERIPGGAPRGIHDPALFVDRRELIRICASNGVNLRLNGLRPSALGMLRRWLFHSPEVKMVRTVSTAILFQGVGVKN